MKATWLVILALMSGTAAAQTPGPVASNEIQYLFSYLEGSGCQFLRNGNWHSAQDASSHLRQKYKYLTDRGLVSTAESFIEKGASASSMSGTPYQVRCTAEAKPEPSALWFKAVLARYRETAR